MTAAWSDEPDQVDMARLAGGHDSALNELMARHGDRLFGYLVRLLQSEAEAADLAQETFVRIYLHRAKFRPGQRFVSWLYSIATNLARDRLRWRARHPQVPLDPGPAEDAAGLAGTLREGRPSPSETLVAAERATAIRQAVAALPEDLRVPLILAEYEEQSQAEIASLLGCTPKAVEMRLYRARQALRASLQPLLREP